MLETPDLVYQSLDSCLGLYHTFCSSGTILLQARKARSCLEVLVLAIPSDDSAVLPALPITGSLLVSVSAFKYQLLDAFSGPCHLRLHHPTLNLCRTYHCLLVCE